MTVAPTLAIETLSVSYDARNSSARIHAVRQVSLTVESGECLGLIGESGSGKTQVCMAAMGLLSAGARVTGSVRFAAREILTASPAALNSVRGSKLAMIFQDPMTSLTPHLKIGTQLAEVLVEHAQMSWRDAERAVLDALIRVRVPDPSRRLRQYPHELSGGMRQRVMIGMSLLCEPSLLIADEPTTALDVTVQAQIIDLLRAIRLESRMAVLLISHDVGVVAGLADRILVMYGGRIVESAPAAEILAHAAHPYTAELLRCVPNLRAARVGRMPSLPGQPPSPSSAERGCAFAPRCARAAARCATERPLLELTRVGHSAACHFPLST